MEKISLKLEIMAEAGKPDRLRELAITEFDLGTVVPVLKDCRLVPSDNIFNKSKENMDLTLRALLSYKDGDAKLGVKVFIKHDVPLLPHTFNLIVQIRDLVLDLKIVCGAHPIKRLDISIVEKPIVDFDPMEGGDLQKLRKIPGWEKWGKEKVRNLINEAIQEKLCDILKEPERQYVAMPGVDSDEEYDEVEEPVDPLDTWIKKMVDMENLSKVAATSPASKPSSAPFPSQNPFFGTGLGGPAALKKHESDPSHQYFQPAVTVSPLVQASKTLAIAESSESESPSMPRIRPSTSSAALPSALTRNPTSLSLLNAQSPGSANTDTPTSRSAVISPRGLPRTRGILSTHDRNSEETKSSSTDGSLDSIPRPGTPLAGDTPGNTPTPTGRRRGMSRTQSLTGLTKLSDGDTMGANNYSKNFTGDIITTNQTNKREERSVEFGSPASDFKGRDDSVEDKKKRKGFLSNFTGKKKDDEKKRASIDEWDLRINSQPVTKKPTLELADLKSVQSEKPSHKGFSFRSKNKDEKESSKRATMDEDDDEGSGVRKSMDASGDPKRGNLEGPPKMNRSKTSNALSPRITTRHSMGSTGSRDQAALGLMTGGSSTSQGGGSKSMGERGSRSKGEGGSKSMGEGGSRSMGEGGSSSMTEGGATGRARGHRSSVEVKKSSAVEEGQGGADHLHESPGTNAQVSSSRDDVKDTTLVSMSPEPSRKIRITSPGSKKRPKTVDDLATGSETEEDKKERSKRSSSRAASATTSQEEKDRTSEKKRSKRRESSNLTSEGGEKMASVEEEKKERSKRVKSWKIDVISLSESEVSVEEGTKSSSRRKKREKTEKPQTTEKTGGSSDEKKGANSEPEAQGP